MSERAKEYYRIATWAFIGLAAAYSICLRVYLAWGLPLWLDESWTAVLSSAPDLRTFARYMWIDINAPLYFALMWLWPFESDIGLKLPSLIFLLAAACVAVLWRPSGVRRDTALVWAALLLLWQPGIGMFIDARYYALLMLLSTAQTIALIKLLDEPSLKRACWWTGMATLAVMTHYHAALLAVTQGMVYLWYHRLAAVRTWPALLLVLPGAAWGVYHLPRLLAFVQPGVAWYYPFKLKDFPELLSWPFAPNWVAGVVLAVIIGIFWKKDRLAPNVAITVLASLIALGAFITLGFLRPMLIERYMMPVVPALLLGVASVVRPAGYLPVVAWFLLTIGGPAKWAKEVHDVRWFGLELPARYLPDAKRVTWQMGPRKPPPPDKLQLEAILSDAFKRNGRVVEARYGGELMAGDGLIWLFYREDLLSIEVQAKWNCRTFDGGYYTIMVCSRPK